jgi:hypothetical protein
LAPARIAAAERGVIVLPAFFERQFEWAAHDRPGIEERKSKERFSAKGRRSVILTELLARSAHRGAASLGDLLQVPDLCVDTMDLPQNEWPILTDLVRYEEIGIALALTFFNEVPLAVLKMRSWHLLLHQCEGLLCSHVAMVAVRLEPRPATRDAFINVARRFWQSNFCWFEMSGVPNDHPDLRYRRRWFAEYRAQIGPLGLRCDRSYHHLREAVYPAYATQEALDDAAINPPNLATLTGGWPKNRQSSAHWPLTATSGFTQPRLKVEVAMDRSLLRWFVILALWPRRRVSQGTRR